MNRATALERLRELKPWLIEQGIERVRLVGSTARDAARPDSDVDLLVEFGHMPGLRFFAIERELSERMGVKVELLLEGGLNPIVRERMLADAVDA